MADFSFDLDDLNGLYRDTKNVCDELNERRQLLKKGINVLRKDWKTPAGEKFFKNMDTDWEQNVVKFEETIKKFEEVLQFTVNEFQAVEEYAEKIKM